MRKTYRWQNNKEYWTERWAVIPPDDPMENAGAYPLKYALKTVKNKDGTILEAGCGGGRILRYYKKIGYTIKGIDFIEQAVEKLKVLDPELDVEVGDITGLQFRDASFRYVLAFGLYHNLENNLNLAVRETHRVLEKKGVVCASFRADNIQTLFTDWLTEYRAGKKNKGTRRYREFHKMNLKMGEFIKLFEKNGFTIEHVFPVENMPFLYKFSIFRASEHKVFNENIARKEGYRLSNIGGFIQEKLLMKFFPNQFCNIYVLIARKA